MFKTFKNIIKMYICWSPLLALPTWIITGMTLTAIYGTKTLLLPSFAILIITWLFVFVYIETCSNMSEKENQKYTLYFSIFNTIGLFIILYFCVFNMDTIIAELTPPIWK